MLIEYVDKIVDMRRHLVQEESRFPAELTRTFKSMETQGNPWGIDAGSRADWANGLEIPTIADKPDAEYLYFVGCAGSFDDRHKRTTQALVKVLRAAKVDFAILGVEEPCNGETARRIGNEYLFQTMAQMAVEVLNGYQVRKIITNCPHCFNTFKNDYPQFGGNFEVIHATDRPPDRRGQTGAQRRRPAARSPTTTPATSAATTACSMLRATSSARFPAWS